MVICYLVTSIPLLPTFALPLGPHNVVLIHLYPFFCPLFCEGICLFCTCCICGYQQLSVYHKHAHSVICDPLFPCDSLFHTGLASGCHRLQLSFVSFSQYFNFIREIKMVAYTSYTPVLVSLLEVLPCSMYPAPVCLTVVIPDISCFYFLIVWCLYVPSLRGKGGVYLLPRSHAVHLT